HRHCYRTVQEFLPRRRIPPAPFREERLDVPPCDSARLSRSKSSSPFAKPRRNHTAVRGKLTRIVLMLSVFATSAFAVGQGDRYTGAPFATRSPVLAQHGMAATMQPLATQIAIDILKKGGTAMDAAIAANAALGLMEPVSCG